MMRVIRTIMRFPVTTATLSLLICVASLIGILRIEKDPSVDAFVSRDHPAAVAREKAQEIFGLEDPIIIGLAAPTGESAFTATTLSALRRIQERVRGLPNVDGNRVISVLTEKSLSGQNGDLQVDPIVGDGEITEPVAALAWERLQRMPMWRGVLASGAGDMVVMIVPVHDPNRAETTHQDILTIVDQETPEGLSGHVGGALRP